jgi:hypothetical protein
MIKGFVDQFNEEHDIKRSSPTGGLRTIGFSRKVMGYIPLPI